MTLIIEQSVVDYQGKNILCQGTTTCSLSTREFQIEILCSGKSQGFSCIQTSRTKFLRPQKLSVFEETSARHKPRLIKNFQFLTAIEDKSPRGSRRGGTSFF